MENFNEYWELFIDKKDSIAKEIIAYYKTLDDSEDGFELSEECCCFLRKNILLNPYPTCQLLITLATSKIPDRINTIFNIAAVAVLQAFSENNYAEDERKRYSILANCLLSEKAIIGLRSKIIHALESKVIDLEWLMLALFVRKSIKVLVHLLPEFSILSGQKWAAAALQTKHFLSSLLEAPCDSKQSCLLHIKYIRFVEQMMLANNEKGLFSMHVLNVRVPFGHTTVQSYLEAYLVELQRCYLLQNIARVDELLPAKYFSESSTVLGLLLKTRKNLIGYDISTFLSLVSQNRLLIEQISTTVNQKSPLGKSEITSMFKIYALIVLFQAMKSDVEGDGDICSNSSNFDTLFKCLLKDTDIETFVKVTESIFIMLFTRGEVVPEGFSTSGGKYFICNTTLLGTVGSSMKTIMIARKHSTSFHGVSEQLKVRFRTMLELVTDVCWRLSLLNDVLKTGDESSHRQIRLISLQLVPKNLSTYQTDNCVKSALLSSSERGVLFRSVESIPGIESSSGLRARLGFNGTLPRHNPARRHSRYPMTAAGSSNSGGSHKELQRKSSLPLDTQSDLSPHACVAGRNDNTRNDGSSALKNKKAFAKCFASPEMLAITCLTSNKLFFAKQIIENYTLQHLPVGKIVERIEELQSLQKNLINVVQKHDIKEESLEPKESLDSEGRILLEDIRLKTAHGFQISKILSMIETYLKSLPIKDSKNDGSVFQTFARFVGRYPFLRFQTEKNLHLSQIVDIIFSLSFKYELNLAIYNFLLKNVQPVMDAPSCILSTSMSGAGAEMSQFVRNYVTVFGSIIDALQILLRASRKSLGAEDGYQTIGHLLSRELCSLDPLDNGVVFKRRFRFQTLIEKESENDQMGLESLDARSLILQADIVSPCLESMKHFLENLTTLLAFFQKDKPVTQAITHAKADTDLQRTLMAGVTTMISRVNSLDAVAADLGVNLIYTIGKSLLVSNVANNTCMVDDLWQFIKSKSEIILDVYQAQLCDTVSTTSSCLHSLILQFEKHWNIGIVADVMSNNQCFQEQFYEKDQHSQVLFPLERIRTCCSLQTKEEKDLPATWFHWMCSESISMEPKATELLGNVNRFANGSEWIKASKHLQTAIFTKQSVLHEQMSTSTYQQLQQRADLLRMYSQIGTILRESFSLAPGIPGGDGFLNVSSLCESKKSQVLQQLIEHCEYRVCAEWIKLHPIDGEKELEMFMCAIHRATTTSQEVDILHSPSGNTPVRVVLTIIETMPTEVVAKLYETMLLNIRSVPLLSYMLRYLQSHGERKPLYQKYTITLKIFDHLSREEIDGLWQLASHPLLIIEQCLMNSRLELLAEVIRSIRPLLVEDICRPCFEYREYIRDLRDAAALPRADQLLPVAGVSSKRNPVHDGLFIGHECLDCLLRVYAGKALEYKVYSETVIPNAIGISETASRLADGSRAYSFDSLSEMTRSFIMPKKIPPREQWVKDEDALHCMCCRRTFSMLNRRHHCRRCGRVVCNSCSKHKERLQDLYEDAAVRVCEDCWQHLKDGQTGKLTEGMESTLSSPAANSLESEQNQFEWHLTGNERYDNVIRDEYSYEYAPSTGQCLAICSLHTSNEEISAFLLYHCAKLEALLRPLHPGLPNPEIDYALVARMLLNLALGVKVRGGGTEVEKMKEHAEIILSIVQVNCDSLLLHVSAMNSHGSLRKLRDALVKAEQWTLALELSLKCGFSMNGVMAAWGMTCLRAGCYDTAREKFSHCLPRLASEPECDALLRMIEASLSGTPLGSMQTVPVVKRPTRGPPLLHEILYSLSCTARFQAPCQRVQAKLQASKPLPTTAIFAGASEPTHDTAMNILSTLAHLHHICKGDFEADSASPPVAKHLVRVADHGTLMESQLFEESMHYLLAYGSHQNVVAFLMLHRQTEVAALHYILCQRVEPEVFLQIVLLPHLHQGALETLVRRLTDIDETLFQWRDYIRYTCRYFETNYMLNSLYNLQLLLKDPIRASMTCVRFYVANCRTFSELYASEHFLKTSITHLQNELELCNWQKVRMNSTGSIVETHRSLLMKLDPKELNNHINTILLQLEVTKFLAACESKGRQTIAVLAKILRESSQLPTLFGTSHEKLQLAILTLVCGQNVEEAFGLSYRIIQDYNLEAQQVYTLTAKYYINYGNIEDVGKLLDAIASSGVGTLTEPVLSAICDEIVRVSVDTAIARHGAVVDTKIALEALIGRVSSVAERIHCYIVSGQLKTAYLLANRHHRIRDIRKILRQAELQNQTHVKRLCEVRLNHCEIGTVEGEVDSE